MLFIYHNVAYRCPQNKKIQVFCFFPNSFTVFVTHNQNNQSIEKKLLIKEVKGKKTG